MFSITHKPAFTIYNTTSEKEPPKKSNRHWRQYSSGSSERPCMKFAMTPKPKTLMRDRVVELELEIEKYKKVNSKLKLLAGWNVRASKSTLKDSQEMLDIIEDLYGDEAIEKQETILD
jgi:hypothetical protein